MFRPVSNFPKLRARALAEDGAVSIPAVLFLPVLLMIMFASVELGILHVRQVLLDRGLDMTVRILRLNITPLPADPAMALATLRKDICTNIGFIHNCMNDLTVEMFRVVQDDTVTVVGTNTTVTRSWYSTGAGSRATCTNRNLSGTPTVTLDRGAANDLILVRACLKVDPMMPDYGFGAMLRKDAAGQVALVSQSAYVREPFYK